MYMNYTGLELQKTSTAIFSRMVAMESSDQSNVSLFAARYSMIFKVWAPQFPLQLTT
jgi:hypothetical protein